MTGPCRACSGHMNVLLQRPPALVAGRNRCHNRPVSVDIPEQEAFAEAWAALPWKRRAHLRRMVRLGMPLADSEHVALGVAYARFQRGRIWARLFWLWFVPGLLLALGVALRIHPLVVGVVLALSAQAVFAHRNLGRVEQVNAAVLDG